MILIRVLVQILLSHDRDRTTRSTSNDTTRKTLTLDPRGEDGLSPIGREAMEIEGFHRIDILDNKKAPPEGEAMEEEERFELSVHCCTRHF